MSANIHLPLLRRGRFLLFAACLAQLLSLLFLMPPSAAHREGAKAFLAFSILLPLALGIPLAAGSHDVMHRPFAMLLPAARRRFLRSHAVAIAGCAGGFAFLAYLADDALLIVAVASIAAAVLTLPLPFEPGWRWAGSRTVAMLMTAAIVAAIVRAVDIKAMAIAHPFVAAAAGLAVTALHFSVAFSATRRRARALTPCTSFLSAAFSPEYTARLKKEAIARKPISRTHWRLATAGDSITAWVHAVFHERFGHERAGWMGMMLTLCAALVALGVILAARDPGRFADRGTQNLWFLLLLLLMAQRSCGPRPAAIYPISRTRRATVAFVASAWQLGMSFILILIATVMTVCIASLWLGVEFQTSAFVKLVTLMYALPFGPLLQWLNLHMEVRNDRRFQVLCSLLAATAGFGGFELAQRWSASLLSPGGLALGVLLIAASQLAYYAALRRFYRKGDLVQRDAAGARLGLV